MQPSVCILKNTTREGGSRGGTYEYLWLIHVEVRAETKTYYKAITLQLKILKNTSNHTLKMYEFYYVEIIPQKLIFKNLPVWDFTWWSVVKNLLKREKKNLPSQTGDTVQFMVGELRPAHAKGS